MGGRGHESSQEDDQDDAQGDDQDENGRMEEDMRILGG
jgi:hypothetical protein